VSHVTVITKHSYPLLFIKQNSFLSSQNFKITYLNTVLSSSGP
jgi:hypothetical protein